MRFGCGCGCGDRDGEGEGCGLFGDDWEEEEEEREGQFRTDAVRNRNELAARSAAQLKEKLHTLEPRSSGNDLESLLGFVNDDPFDIDEVAILSVGDCSRRKAAKSRSTISSTLLPTYTKSIETHP